jgi:hypothetical protein
MHLALSDNLLSNLRSVVPIGQISQTSTRRCSTTGSLSSASATTSKARSKALRTPNYGMKHLDEVTEKYDILILGRLNPTNCKTSPLSVSVFVQNLSFPNAKIRPLQTAVVVHYSQQVTSVQIGTVKLTLNAKKHSMGMSVQRRCSKTPSQEQKKDHSR